MNLTIKLYSGLAIFTLLAFAFSTNAHAQNQGGGTDFGGQTGGGTIGGGITNPATNVGTGGNTGSVGGGGGGVGGGSTAIDASQFDPTNQVQIQPPEDMRREIPFVGPATDSIFNYFEGVGGGAGGGGATGLGGGGAAGRLGGQLGAGGHLGGQFGQFGAQNGFQITRKSIRAPMVAAFSSPVVTGEQVSSRFSDRLVRIPSIQRLGGTESIRVTVTDGTAVISGTVNSIDARDKIERMARMEPGIYSIVNQIQIQQ